MNTAATSAFTRAMLITMRPYLLFLSGITGLAGIAAAGSTSFVIIAPVFIASFLSYGFGQALTDCFQTDTDAISAPYRPLVQRHVRKGSVLIASLLGLAALLRDSSLRGTTSTFFLADWPWQDWPRTRGSSGAGGAGHGTMHGSSVCSFLWHTYPAQMHTTLSIPATLVPLLLIVFSGYANFVLSGYFKDIEADRQTGYNTFPVVFGRLPASLVSDLFAAGAVAGLGLHLASIWSRDPSIGAVATGGSVRALGDRARRESAGAPAPESRGPDGAYSHPACGAELHR